jgi:hypothetical protein
MLDLFGEPITEAWPEPKGLKKKRSDPIPTGGVALAGTGPSGETCGTCNHAMRKRLHKKNVYKCGCNVPHWTHGRKTDILLKTPACIYWSPKWVQENVPFIDRLKD